MLKSWTKWHDDEASVDHFGSPTTRDLTYSLQGDEDPGACFMQSPSSSGLEVVCP